MLLAYSESEKRIATEIPELTPEKAQELNRQAEAKAAFFLEHQTEFQEK